MSEGISLRVPEGNMNVVNMKARIYLGEENHNTIPLDGTLVEFHQGSKTSSIVLEGGENVKKVSGLFETIRTKEGKTETNPCATVRGSEIQVLRDRSREVLIFPVCIRVHVYKGGIR